MIKVIKSVLPGWRGLLACVCLAVGAELYHREVMRPSPWSEATARETADGA